MKKRILCVLLTVVITVGLLPISAISAFAESNNSIAIDFACDVAKTYGTYFTGNYDDSVFKITGAPEHGVEFNNITFENINCGENGACVYIDVYSYEESTGGFGHHTMRPGEITFTNCKFINCSTTEDGGVVYIARTTETSPVIFENCVFINCHAGEDGGAIYSNDSDAQIYGSGNTFITGCSADDDGGGIYMDYGKTIDGFIFADNTADCYGGGICNTANGAAISDCRFYRNTSGSYGGGMYTDKATVEYCKFFENDGSGGGYDLYTGSGSTQIKDCSFTSKYMDYAAAEGGIKYSCTFPAAKDYKLTVGDGSQANSYVIKNIDDWDAFYYMVKAHSRVYYSNGDSFESGTDLLKGKYVRLDDDIIVCNPIGASARDVQIGLIDGLKYTSLSEFTGTFDGNGHTVVAYMTSDHSGEKAAFGLANGATVKNLTVNGYIRGTWSIGGIFGNGCNCIAENCTNNATVYSTESYSGGIAGYSAGTTFINCTNNGKISGSQQVGGIAGYVEQDTFNTCTNNGEVYAGYQKCGGIAGCCTIKGSSFLNCIDHGKIFGGIYVGGIIGYEECAVTVENCIAMGRVYSYLPGPAAPENGFYLIYSALKDDSCLSLSEHDYLQLWDESTASANVFTLTYNQSTDDYTIMATHSGLYLAPYFSQAYSADEWVEVDQISNTHSDRVRWKIEHSDDGYYYIRSRFTNTEGWYLNVQNAGTGNGTVVGVSKYRTNADVKFKLVDVEGRIPKQKDTGAISGHSVSGSSYVQCFYERDQATGNSTDIGLTADVMHGIGSDIIDGRKYRIPDCINDYIKENGKSKNGWLYAALNDNGIPVYIPADALMYIGKNGAIHYAEDPIKVTEDMTSLGESGKDTVYFVDGNVTNTERVQILGSVTLILCDDCRYEVTDGIGIENNGSLTVSSCSLDEHMGKLIVPDSPRYFAGIGSNGDSSCNDIIVYGGDISVQSGLNAAGIGGRCNNIFIYNGIISATGGEFSAGIGGQCNNIYIQGGIISATGGENSVGIGSSSYGSCGNIVINGATVEAVGGKDIAAIGRGKNGTCGSITVAENMYITAGPDKANAKMVYAYNNESYVRMEVPDAARKEPTRTENGHIEYYENASGYYTDEACTKKIPDLFSWLSTSVENGGGMLPAGHKWKPLDAEQHICEICGEKENHTDVNKDNVCDICQFASATGSGLSDGSLWIIIAVAVLALGGVAAVVIVKKKKGSVPAGGDETTDEE